MQLLEKVKNLVYNKYKDSGNLKRYYHIEGVVKMAKTLASRYGVSETKAMIAAYMHDYHKYESDEELELLIDPKDIEECRNCPVLYHSYASAESYKKLIGDDIDIYNAIRNHVFGRLNMSKLEEIILISDYTEEGRTYPSCIECRRLLNEGKFNKAIFESTLYTINLLYQKGLRPHARQIEVLKYYEEVKED